MSTLENELKRFNPDSEAELDIHFMRLSKAFLYGGYISVSDYKEERYKIFIRTVEFYCHYEGDKKDLPKDPIVYHRNGHYVEGEVPYFPLMSFHAHASGYDITFENPELKLRSSALIRAYEVYDVLQKTFLHYDRKKKLFVSCNDSKDRVNKQSTYLYDFINGFGADKIKWVDTPITEQHQELNPAQRQNVYKYDLHENKIVDANGKYIKDDRKWSFTRLDEIENIPD